MRPCHFHGQDAVLEAAPDHDHARDGEIIGLPVAFTDQGIVSVWKPTPAQLALLNAGGGVMCGLLTKGQPPMWLDACGPERILVEA